jgi:AraC-like DNA-binding protein
VSIPAASLLHRHPRARTTDPEEFVAALNATYRSAVVSAVQFPTQPATHELRAVSGPGFAIGYIASPLGVRIVPNTEQSPCYLNFTFNGALHSTAGGDELLNRAELAAVLSTGEPQRLTPIAAGTATVGIKFDRDLLESELAALLGHAPDRPIRFRFGLDLTTPAGRGIVNLVRALLAEADRPPGGVFDHPAVRLHYVRTLLVALLTSHGHSYTDALSRPGSLKPRALRLALDYIDANLAEPITITDLAVAAGCSARTLHDQFQEHLGCSPMSHVKTLRLDRVHQELRRTGRPVTEVAYSWGFTHLGRFSASYRARYGVLPSQTARGA